MKITGIPMSNPDDVKVKKDYILSTIQHSLFVNKDDEDKNIEAMVMSDGYCTGGIIVKSHTYIVCNMQWPLQYSINWLPHSQSCFTTN